MEQILTLFSTVLEQLLNIVVIPLFIGVGQLLNLLVLEPMRLLQLPPAIQVALISCLAALLSVFLRTLLKVEAKEEKFRRQFAAKKATQDDLKLITDWKSKETFAKAIDDEIDIDFNTYLAGRFGRHGIVYLLPIFLTLYWLDSVVVADRFVLYLPPNSMGIPGISTQLLFLIFYCATLMIYFRRRKRRCKQQATECKIVSKIEEPC